MRASPWIFSPADKITATGASQGHENGKRENERWMRLLAWLKDEHNMDIGEGGLRVECRDAEDAGKGLFALQSCSPSTTLFTVPAGAMMNVKTLSSVYSANTVAKLTPVQLISLHLYLHRPDADGVSYDPSFGPYISVLPQSFDSHPLAFTVQQASPSYISPVRPLLDLLPPVVKISLDRLKTKVLADWAMTCKHVSEVDPGQLKTSRKDIEVEEMRFLDRNITHRDDYLWAWLNVNTRCIYYCLSRTQSAAENMTLCPILDFANHTPSNAHIVPVLPATMFSPGSRAPHKASGTLGGDYMFISSNKYPIQKDQELFLQYGAHANRTLFTEYGFVNSWIKGECLRGEFRGEVDLQCVLENMFSKRGNVGVWMKDILEREGYWGDWTMHSSPTPAHPSFRLMAALRLYHLLPEFAENPPRDPDAVLESWYMVLIGRKDIVSEANEQAWRGTLGNVCEDVRDTAKNAIEQLASASQITGQHDKPKWFGWMVDNVRLLWMEEKEVAEAVLASLEASEDF